MLIKSICRSVAASILSTTTASAATFNLNVLAETDVEDEFHDVIEANAEDYDHNGKTSASADGAPGTE